MDILECLSSFQTGEPASFRIAFGLPHLSGSCIFARSVGVRRVPVTNIAPMPITIQSTSAPSVRIANQRSKKPGTTARRALGAMRASMRGQDAFADWIGVAIPSGHIDRDASQASIAVQGRSDICCDSSLAEFPDVARLSESINIATGDHGQLPIVLYIEREQVGS